MTIMAAHRRPVSWAPEAVDDLSAIWTYYAGAGGVASANAIIGKIRAACRILDEHPLAGRARHGVRPGLRCVVASPHLVFYRVVDNGAEIVRVLDGRRDIDEIFAEVPNGE